jgi:hypothetical protein
MEHEEVTTKRIIIDTDPGIDDTAAIFLALASPELHVEALTTVSNYKFGLSGIHGCQTTPTWLRWLSP